MGLGLQLEPSHHARPVAVNSFIASGRLATDVNMAPSEKQRSSRTASHLNKSVFPLAVSLVGKK